MPQPSAVTAELPGSLDFSGELPEELPELPPRRPSKLLSAVPSALRLAVAAAEAARGINGAPSSGRRSGEYTGPGAAAAKDPFEGF